MDLTDLNTAASMAHVLSVLTSQNDYDRDAGVLWQLTGHANRWGYGWTTGNTPAFLWWVDHGTIVLAVMGMRNLTQVTMILAGAETPGIQVGPGRVNPGTWSAAEIIMDQLPSDLFTRQSVFRCAGHSYGGGTALTIVARLLADGLAPNSQVLTFGSPRVIDTAVAGLLNSIPVRRIMNAGDPVPFFPPHWDEAPAASFALGLAASAAIAAWVQPRGGSVLTSQGNLYAREYPPYVLPFKDINLLVWATQGNRFPAIEHNMDTYDARMPAQVAELGPQVPTWPASFKPDTYDPPTAAIWAMGPSAFPGILLEKEMTTKSSVYIPPAYRARFQRVGTTWSVVWLDQIVLSQLNQARARTEAKHLNRLLRVLMNTGLLFQQQWLDSWTQWITAASSTPAGFMPLLPVQ